MNVNELVDSLGDDIKEELATPADVETVDDWPDHVYSEKRKWLRVEDVTVVAADLKNSTKLGFHQYVNTSASIYEAAMTSSVEVATAFDPAYIDIQGDGSFAVFHGPRSVERGLCAAVTLKTLSADQLGPQLTDATGGNVETGLKVGMDRGVIAVKKVGVREDNEPVFAGKPVNWAFKCSQAGDANDLIVTSRVWTKLENNDYVTHSCGCNGGPGELWTSAHVDSLPQDEQSECRRLTAAHWCPECGDDFAQHILEGNKNRKEVRFDPVTHQPRKVG